MKIEDLLNTTINRKASDLHLSSGFPPIIRVDSDMIQISQENLTPEVIDDLIKQVCNETQLQIYHDDLEFDLSYEYKPTKDRFRINIFRQKGTPAAAFRLIPNNIRTIEELFLPNILHTFTRLPQGLVLVTGPTGHGKSTTLAAMIQEINISRAEHIITVEDPIEYVYPRAKSLVEQRELGEDTKSWDAALRSALREDPNVVLIGEMRDLETIQAAITIAETGHLVFATLHTNSASQTVDRIVDVFPDEQQPQIRIQLADIIEGVISQRLIPTIGGGRRVAAEVLLASSAVRNIIREGKTYQLENVIQTSGDLGMINLEKSLVNLVKEGKITLELAQAHSTKPDEILRLFRGRINI